LQVTSDQSGAPYLSHKGMKEAINKTVRDLRQYQTRVQNLENWRQGKPIPEGETVPTMEEITELENRIMELDKELFDIVEEDLENIFVHMQSSEAELEATLANLQDTALRMGLLMEESQLQRLEKIMPVVPESREVLCQKVLEMRILQEPVRMSETLHEISMMYNQYVDQLDEHTQYLEINVAGFRKLLKRHEKQVPQRFHASRTPCLGFHKLVTKSSRQLMDISGMFGSVITDCLERLSSVLETSLQISGYEGESIQCALRIKAECPLLQSPKGLGAECQMVLQIQQQLKDPTLRTMIPQGGPAGFLYPKPGSANDMTPSSNDKSQAPRVPAVAPLSAGPVRAQVAQADLFGGCPSMGYSIQGTVMQYPYQYGYPVLAHLNA